MRNFYIRDILNIATPIIFGNLGFILIGVGDVIVAGRHSTDTLAAISIATAIINCIMMFGIGIISSISAILSNYRGEGKSAEKYFYPSLKFALILSLISSLLIFGFMPMIDKLGLESRLIPAIKDYFWVTALSTFGAYIHCMAKEFLQAFEIVVFPNILTVFCIFVNVALNILFVFGYGPIPSMGAIGLAIASLLTRYFMGFVLVWYCYKKVKIEHHKDKNYYKDLIKVGMPASLAVMIEFIGFNAITIIMGRVSGIYAAAHNIVCTITSVSFMVPLAISNATAVKVGYANGARYFKSLKNYAKTGILLSIGFMAVSAVFVAIFSEGIVKLFTMDKALITVCIPIVYSLCFFQVFDGLQVALAGIFKGIKYTKMVMIANFVGYWIISIPFGSYLAFIKKLNLLGFWYGLIISAIVLCTIMIITMVRKFNILEKDFNKG